MKQLFLRITLSFMLVFPFSLAYGFEFTNGKFIYQTLSDNSVGLCGLTFDDYDNVEELIVPSTVTYDGKSYMVTTIKSGGFLRDKLWQSGVKKVTIPHSVTMIEESSGITSFEQVEMEGGNSTFISSDGILYSAEKDRLIFFPHSEKRTFKVPETVRAIDNYVFYDLPIDSLYIPSTVSKLGYQSFSRQKYLFFDMVDCKELLREKDSYAGMCEVEKIDLGKNVKTIPAGLALGAQKLVKITIPDNVEYIGAFAFDNSGIKEITIGENIKDIGFNAFSNCANLSSINYNAIKLESNKQDMRIFEDCINVSKFCFGDKVKDLPYGLMGGWFIADFYLPDNIESIQGYALWVANKELKLSKNIKYIAEDALLGCSELRDLYYDIPYVCNEMENWLRMPRNLKTITIGPNVLSLPASMFSGSEALEKIEIPENVDSIGLGCFYGCKNLKEVKLSPKLSYIGRSAFGYCTNLPKIDLPNSVKHIGYGAFENCTSFTSLTIPENLEVIEDNAFKGCKGIKKLDYNARKIDCARQNLEYSFMYDCPLEKINIGEKVEFLPGYFMARKKDVPYFEIPQNVKCIGDEAFYAVNIEEFVIPTTVEYIGNKAFHETNLYDTFERIDDILYINNIAYEYLGNNNGYIENLKFRDGTVGISSGWYLSYNKKPINFPETLKYIGYGLRTMPWTDGSIFFKGVLPPKAILGEHYKELHLGDPLSCRSFEEYTLYTLYVPKGSKQRYMEAEYWNLFPNIKEYDVTGINNVTLDSDASNCPIYNMNGQRVDGSYKGVVIQNGKKRLAN